MNATAQPMTPEIRASRGPAAPSGGASTSLTAKEIIGILRRRLWLIIIITGIVTICAGVLWFVFLKTAPRYTSVGYIECKMPVPDNLLTPQRLLPRAELIELETQTKAVWFRSEAFLAKVLERDAVRQTAWYKNLDSPTDRLEEMKDDFGASPRRETSYVVVSMTAANAGEAATILNEAITAFQQDMAKAAKGGLSGDLASLQEERNGVERLISVQKDRLLRLHQDVKSPGWDRGRSPLLLELESLTQERTYLSYQLNKLTNDLNSLNEDLEAGRLSGVVQFEINNDPMVRYHQQRIVQLDESKEQLLERFGIEHDQVKGINTMIEANEKAMNAKQQELQQTLTLAQKDGLERQIEEQKRLLGGIQGQFLEKEAKQNGIEAKITEFQGLKQELEDLNHRLVRYDNQIDSTKSLIRSQGGVSTIPHHGTRPLQRSFPKWQVFLPGGLILGIMISIGLAFLLEFMDDTIKAPADISRHLRLPMLGMIPAYEQDEAEDEMIAKLVVSHPHELISEAYRQFKTNLLFSGTRDQIKTLLLTGSAAGAGTTTTAVNLALTLASEGMKVLLIDANFHRPKLKEIFPGDGEDRGLSYYLVGQADGEQIIQSTGEKGMDVIHSGPKPPNPADLLKSARMKELLDQVKSHYDTVLIDGPPGLVVSDTRLLAGIVDGTIIVVEASKTARGVAQRLIREFQSTQIKVLGLVLNSVRSRKGGYFREAFESYYDYVGGEPAESKEA
jgi:capsular exopolysaccharide synthesis family protein